MAQPRRIEAEVIPEQKAPAAPLLEENPSPGLSISDLHGWIFGALLLWLCITLFGEAQKLHSNLREPAEPAPPTATTDGTPKSRVQNLSENVSGFFETGPIADAVDRARSSFKSLEKDISNQSDFLLPEETKPVREEEERVRF